MFFNVVLPTIFICGVYLMIRNKSFHQFFYMVSLIGILASCTNAVPFDTRSKDQTDNDPFYDNSKRETIWGDGGLNFFSDKKNNSNKIKKTKLMI